MNSNTILTKFYVALESSITACTCLLKQYVPCKAFCCCRIKQDYHHCFNLLFLSLRECILVLIRRNARIRSIMFFLSHCCRGFVKCLRCQADRIKLLRDICFFLKDKLRLKLVCSIRFYVIRWSLELFIGIVRYASL